jgi:hypothetical protein
MHENAVGDVANPPFAARHLLDAPDPSHPDGGEHTPASEGDEWSHDIEATLERYRTLAIRRREDGRLGYPEAEEFGRLHSTLSAALRSSTPVVPAGLTTAERAAGETLADKIDRSLEAALDNAGIYNWDIRRAVLDCRDELLGDLRSTTPLPRSLYDGDGRRFASLRVTMYDEPGEVEETTRLLGLRWNAVADALAVLDREQEGTVEPEKAARDARMILRAAVLGEEVDRG